MEYLKHKIGEKLQEVSVSDSPGDVNQEYTDGLFHASDAAGRKTDKTNRSPLLQGSHDKLHSRRPVFYQRSPAVNHSGEQFGISNGEAR